jgi:hypothetical protein
MPRLDPVARDASALARPFRRRSRIDELRMAGGFFKGLRTYLRRSLDPDDGRARLERQLAARERTFVSLLRRGVFENPSSPYRRLFEWAGITFDDAVETLGKEGLEGGLERFCDAGIYVTWDEFKGRRSIRRPGFELRIRAQDFDNPLSARHYEAQTGGSTGTARRILVDLDLLEHESAYHAAFFAAAKATERPIAIWHPVPPGAVGMKTALIQAKLGRSAERWFSHSRLRDGDLRHAVFTRGTIRGTGMWGARIPPPEYTPTADASRVAGWLARKRAGGAPGVLVTTASGGVRACRAALEGGFDIGGTLFVLGGEPYTPAKAAVVAETGSDAVCHYAMAETGAIGIACRSSEAVDDVHLVSDKIATVQRDRSVGANGATVQSLLHTTLLPASPKLMLNVESGDYGLREDRECGCGVLPNAFRRHLHTIRSYEKLNSEGMSFLGSDLITLIEEVLPARFGGHPTDYQLLERENGGLPKVHLIVRSAVGELDDDQVSRSVLGFLRSRGQPERLMADIWDQGQTLKVVRGEPHVTPGSKILPLHMLSG